MSTTPPPRTPRPTRQQLGGQVRAVLADLPLFLTAPLFRRWHLRWGATPGEVEAALPGDELRSVAADERSFLPALVGVGDAC
jgi:hypothetical protein